MVTVAAFDPGATTGFAIQRDGRLITLGEISWPEEWSAFTALLSDHEVDEIVCEKLHIGARSFNPIGFEVVGVIRYLSMKFDLMMVEQQPSVMATAERWLEAVNHVFPPSEVHARDAYLHLTFRHQAPLEWDGEKALSS